MLISTKYNYNSNTDNMIHGTLSRRGYSVFKSDLTEEQLKEVKNDLTVSPYIPESYKVGKTPSFKVYLESTSKLYLPKAYAIDKFGPPSDIKISHGADIDVEFKGSLRDAQIDPVNAFLNAAHDPCKMGGILNLQCAEGKTVMAIYLICTLKKKTIVIVHKDFLIQQWKERIQEFAPSAQIGIIKAKTVDIHDKDIVIASLQSLSMKDYPSDTFDDIGFLIADECHHLAAEVFSCALQKINTRFTLGLSATVKRKDGLSKVFMWYLGGIVFKRKTRKNDIINVNVIKYDCNDPDYCEECVMYGNKPNMSKMINNICDYGPRVHFIVVSLLPILQNEPERRVLVLSDRRNHLPMFKEAFDKYGYTSSGYYYGGMKTEDLKESEGKQIILGTYAMISEGFDVKGLDTLVLASPKSDVVQSVGRILREKPEARKHVPIVVDVVDDFAMFPRQAKKRIAYYKSCKYNISSDANDTPKQCHKLVQFDELVIV